jgi:tetratricopeptide (TPR) repeat protein
MKRVQLILCVILLATLTALAQAPEASDEPTPTRNDKKTSAPAQPTPQQQPGSSKPLPQAKTQDEFKAYQDAMATVQKGDPVQGEAATDAFAAKFKTSEITPVLYHRVMQLYQGANNADKAIEVGNKILAISPNDPIANVIVASMMSERISDTDLDKEQRLAEAEKDANRALQTVDTDFMANPGTPQQTIDSAKNMIRSMAYAALANCENTKLNYAGAEQYFNKASSFPDAPLDPVSTLRFAIVLDKEKKYPEALTLTNKVIDASPAGSQVQNMAKSEHDRLTMLVPASAPASAPAPQTTKP